jgi:hypothetical protein
MEVRGSGLFYVLSTISKYIALNEIIRRDETGVSFFVFIMTNWKDDGNVWENGTGG